MSLKFDGFVTLIQVFDMPTSLVFYRDVLGFYIISDAPADGRCDWAWLREPVVTSYGMERVVSAETRTATRCAFNSRSDRRFNMTIDPPGRPGKRTRIKVCTPRASFNLDGDLTRQPTHSYRRAGVLTTLAKHIDGSGQSNR